MQKSSQTTNIAATKAPTIAPNPSPALPNKTDTALLVEFEFAPAVTVMALRNVSPHWSEMPCHKATCPLRSGELEIPIALGVEDSQDTYAAIMFLVHVVQRADAGSDDCVKRYGALSFSIWVQVGQEIRLRITSGKGVSWQYAIEVLGSVSGRISRR